MKRALEEVKRALASEKHRYLSEETLQLCLEALTKVVQEEHNGMSNYPTWVVAAYIDNNEELYNSYWRLVKEMWSAGEDDFSVIGVLTQTIEADFSEDCKKLQRWLGEKKQYKNVWESILNHADKDLIHYREIAKRFIEG